MEASEKDIDQLINHYKNGHKSAIFQNIKNSEVQTVSPCGRILWCKFQQNLTRIDTLDTLNFLFFYDKNRHKSAIFQNIKNSEIQIVSLYGRMLWCKFQQNRTNIATPDTFCVKYSKFQIFCTFL